LSQLRGAAADGRVEAVER